MLDIGAKKFTENMLDINKRYNTFEIKKINIFLVTQYPFFVV